MINIRDQFEREYQEWMTNPEYPGKKNSDRVNLPRMECLSEIIDYYKGKIPYSVLSEENRMWENLCTNNENKINFKYTIFISVFNNFLIAKPEFLEPDEREIERWWNSRK